MDPSLQTLKNNRLLSENFSEQELGIFAKYLTIQSYPGKSPIMREGDSAGNMMFLLSGRAEVLSDGVHLATLEAQCFFGESMFVSDAVRIADVVSTEKCCVAIFSLNDYRNFKQEAPETALKFCNFFTRERKDKAADKERAFSRIDIWGRELSAWLDRGAPLRS